MSDSAKRSPIRTRLRDLHMARSSLTCIVAPPDEARLSALEMRFLVSWRRRFPDAAPVILSTVQPYLEWHRRLNRRGGPMQADFSWPQARIVLEIEGGTWARGRRKAGHAHGRGILRDIQKANVLAAAGWTLFRMDAKLVANDAPTERKYGDHYQLLHQTITARSHAR